MSAPLDDLDDAFREFAELPPKPLARQFAEYPWSPPAIDRQPTRYGPSPPPLPPEAIAERLQTVARQPDPVMLALEGAMATAYEAERLRARVESLAGNLRILANAIRAMRAHLLQLAPAVPRQQAIVTCSLEMSSRALAAVGEQP